MMGNSQALVLSSTADFELTIQDIHISSIFTSRPTIRSKLTLSIYEYFNDYRYSITINDIVESGTTALGTAKTDISFEVKKGGFLDWTGNEIDYITMAYGAPTLYKELGDNLDLQWPTQLPELICASTSFCTPNDLFTFLGGVYAEDAKNLMMEVELAGYSQTVVIPDPVPAPTTLPLIGLGLLCLARLRHRRIKPANI